MHATQDRWACLEALKNQSNSFGIFGIYAHTCSPTHRHTHTVGFNMCHSELLFTEYSLSFTYHMTALKLHIVSIQGMKHASTHIHSHVDMIIEQLQTV